MIKSVSQDTILLWVGFNDNTRLELLKMTTIPKKYHEGLSYMEELNPHNLETMDKLIVKKISKAIKEKYG